MTSYLEIGRLTMPTHNANSSYHSVDIQTLYGNCKSAEVCVFLMFSPRCWCQWQGGGCVIECCSSVPVYMYTPHVVLSQVKQLTRLVVRHCLIHMPDAGLRMTMFLRIHMVLLTVFITLIAWLVIRLHSLSKYLLWLHAVNKMMFSWRREECKLRKFTNMPKWV